MNEDPKTGSSPMPPTPGSVDSRPELGLGFVHGRQQMQLWIRAMGERVCAYTFAPAGQNWLATRCDCKYGGSGQGEETGCPELRSMYYALDVMTDEEWDLLTARAGGTNTELLFSMPPGLPTEEAKVIAEFFTIDVERVQAVVRLSQMRAMARRNRG